MDPTKMRPLFILQEVRVLCCREVFVKEEHEEDVCACKPPAGAQSFSQSYQFTIPSFSLNVYIRKCMYIWFWKKEVIRLFTLCVYLCL